MTTPSQRGDQLAAQIGTDAANRVATDSTAERETESSRATTVPAPPPSPSEPPVSEMFDKIAPDQLPEDLPPTLREGSGEHRAAVLTLGERALEWCLTEAAQWLGRRVITDRVCEYLKGCVRNGKKIGPGLAQQHRSLGGIAFCAAAQGFAEFSVRYSSDAPLPPWRAAALELMNDAKAGLRPGEEWVSVEDVLAQRRWPPPGSIPIYANTQSNWKGHAERVLSGSAEGYISVGANENGGKWWIDPAPLSYRNASRADGSQRLALLGFIMPVKP